MPRFHWIFLLLTALSFACEKEMVTPCIEPFADQLIAGQTPENGCGILQTTQQEVPNPERGDSSKLLLDVNLDGEMDFEFVATFSASPSHSNYGLQIGALNNQAFFGISVQDYGICYLLNPTKVGYPSIDCRRSCSDFTAEEITEELDTVLRSGQIVDIQGLESGSIIDDNRPWAQSFTHFAKPNSQAGVRNCLAEVIDPEYKWSRSAILYLPIKLVNNQGMTTLGWIKCQFDRQKNPIYESFIQTY